MLWLYELALNWFISSPTGRSDEADCLTMGILFSPFKPSTEEAITLQVAYYNTWAEFLVPAKFVTQKFVALTNIVNSLD